MIKYLLVILTLASSITASAQPEVLTDANGSKILKGFMTRADLNTDPQFAWFVQNQQGFTPDATGVQAVKAAKDSIHFLRAATGSIFRMASSPARI